MSDSPLLKPSNLNVLVPVDRTPPGPPKKERAKRTPTKLVDEKLVDEQTG